MSTRKILRTKGTHGWNRARWTQERVQISVRFSAECNVSLRTPFFLHSAILSERITSHWPNTITAQSPHLKKVPYSQQLQRGSFSCSPLHKRPLAQACSELDLV
jgi:hypothetical protein